MIKLSKRLDAIAALIDEEDIVIDIGCDHALLDIYLSFKYNKIYYASDLRESALNMARNNISKYKCNNVILKNGNGLSTIDKSMNINTIVISGMGYMTITHILKNIRHMKNINKLVIQSNSNTEIVRKFMIKNGFYIDKEKLVLDKNIYYIISVFKRGKKIHNKIDINIGIMDNIDTKYIDVELKKNNVLLNLIPKKHIIKRYYIKQKIKYLNKKRILIK